MKIDTTTKPKAFEPVTITIQSEAELNFFRDVIGDAPDSVQEAYGFTGLYQAYCALDAVFKDRGIERNEATRVTYEIKEK